MSITRKAISVGLSAAMLASLAATVVAPAAFAGATVTAANANVSADTAVSGSQALTGPSIDTTASGDIPTGILAFSAPAGYAFDTSSTPGVSANTTGATIVFVSETATTLTYQVTGASTGSGTLTFSGWAVKATAGTPLAAPGNITLNAGGSVPVGVTTGASGTNFGTLTEVAGATVQGPGKLKVTASTLSPAPGATISLTAQYVDQFGNWTSDPHTSFLGAVWSQTSTGASGTFTNVTNFGVGSGEATADFTVSSVAGQSYTLTVNDLWSSSGTVGPIVVTPAVVTPPATPGTITVSNTVSIPRGGSAVTLGTYTFTEGLAGDWGANQYVTVCFAPASGPSSSLTLAGGTVTGPDALTSPSLSLNGNCFTVTIGGSDNTRIEAFSVSGLTLQASSAAGPGTIAASYTTNLGNNALYFAGSSTTASGTLAFSYNAGTQPMVVNMASTTAFQAGSATIGGESVMITNVTSSGACGPYALTSGQECITATTTAFHAANSVVTESVVGPNGTAPSPGTVIDALALSSAGAPQLLVGVTNQSPAEVTLAEQQFSTGLLAAGTVITLKITTPGVLFSNAPVLDVSASTLGTGFGLASNTGTLSLDRTSATFTVNTADTSGTTSLVFSMMYDVASTASGPVNLQVTAGSIAVVPPSVVNATLGASVFVTSNAPTIYINQNDQPIGNVTITEKSAGALSSAAGTNTFFVCLTTGEYFIRPPWAVVTSGDLKISTNSSLTAGASQAAGTQITGPGVYNGDNCYAWAVYSASTTPSTIAIEGVDANGNPTPTAHVNVPAGLTPGPTYLAIGSMASMSSTSGNLIDLATVAVRAFQSGITVTAATPVPFIAPGATNAAASNLTIAETGNNLLQAGEVIQCTVLARSSNYFIQDTLLASAVSNVLPIVSTNGATTGLQAHLSYWSSTSFRVTVDQAAVAGLGSITISNLTYNVNAAAPNGPVLVECKLASAPEASTAAPFDQFVSNAVIGTPVVKSKVVISAYGSGGTTYSISSQILAKGQKLVVTFKTSPKLAGEKLGIWLEVRQRGATSFGPFKPHASIVLDYNGVGTYTYSASSGVKIGLSGRFLGNDTLMPATSYPTIFGLFQ